MSEILSPATTLPGPKPSWPFGNLKQFDFKQVHTYLKERAIEYGPIYRLNFFGRELVVLSRPSTLQYIYKNRPHTFRRLERLREVLGELEINGIFSMEGDTWRRHRPLINSAFSPKYLKGFQATLNRIAGRLSNKLDNMTASGPASVECQSLMQDFTVDVTAALIFGQDMNSLENGKSSLQQDLAKVMPMLNHRVRMPFSYWRWLKTPFHRDFEKSLARIRARMSDYIKTARAQLDNNGGNANNLLESMIAVTQEEGSQFTEQELYANVMVLLVAGEDTTANSLAWTLHYLADQTRWQRAMHEEITQVNHNLTELNYEQLNDYPKTFAAAQEAMRLMPVAPMMYLQPMEDVELEGYLIPKDTMIITLTSQASYDESLFKQCEQFQPERWLEMDESQRKRVAKSLLSFGGGPRVCPGRQLSYMEMKTALANVFGKFTFYREANQPPCEDIFDFTVMPKNLQLTVKRVD